MTTDPTTPTPAIAEGEPTLLPCPFCGGTPEFVADRLEPKTPNHVYLLCKRCDTYAPGDFSTRAEQVAAWNRRPSPEGRREVLDTPENVERVMDVLIDASGNCQADAKRILAVLQATPARTGEGPLTREEVATAMRFMAGFWGKAEEEAQRLALIDSGVVGAIAYYLAWSQVRGSLRTGEREAALREALGACDAEASNWDDGTPPMRAILFVRSRVEALLMDRSLSSTVTASPTTTPPPATPLDALGERAAGRAEATAAITRWLLLDPLHGGPNVPGRVRLANRISAGDHLSTPTEKPPGGERR